MDGELTGINGHEDETTLLPVSQSITYNPPVVVDVPRLNQFPVPTFFDLIVQVRVAVPVPVQGGTLAVCGRAVPNDRSFPVYRIRGAGSYVIWQG